MRTQQKRGENSRWASGDAEHKFRKILTLKYFSLGDSPHKIILSIIVKTIWPDVRQQCAEKIIFRLCYYWIKKLKMRKSHKNRVPSLLRFNGSIEKDAWGNCVTKKILNSKLCSFNRRHFKLQSDCYAHSLLFASKSLCVLMRFLSHALFFRELCLST